MEPPRRARDPRALRRAAVLLAILWAVVFAPELFGGRTFVLGDARVYRPFAEFSRARWQERHERTFWNPFVLCGVSAGASLADMRPQYLPDALLDLVERVRPGRVVPLAGPLLAHLAGMIGVAALAWRLWGLPEWALAWAGAAWGLSPILLVPLTFGHDAYLVAAALLPVELLAVALAWEAAGALALAAAGLALAAVSGAQALCGHPQVVAYSGVLACAFAFERAARLGRPRRLAVVVAGLAGGAAISMAVWWPALLYGAHSGRGISGFALEDVRRLSLAWYEPLAFAWPQAVGGAGATYWGGLWNTDYARFLGTTVVAAALVASLGARPARPAGRRFLWGAALASVALALGPRLGLAYRLLHRFVPPFARLRVASMALVVTVLVAALLSAAALVPAAPPGQGRQRPGAPRPPRSWWWWVPLAAAQLLGGALAAGRLDGAYSALARSLRPALGAEAARSAARLAGLDLLARVPLLAVLLVLLLALRAGRARPRLAGAALCGLLVADLGAVTVPALVRGSAAPAVLTSAPMPELARIGAAEPAARVLSTRTVDVAGWQVTGLGRHPEAALNDWIRWRARAFGGDHGTPPAGWGDFGLVPSVSAMRALGIVYVSTLPGWDPDTSVADLVARADGEKVYRLRGAPGRAYAVARVARVPDDSTAVAEMLDERFDARAEALTTDPDAAGSYPGSAACRLRWLADEPDRLALAAAAPGPAFVVVADAWFPGWSATLDGQPVPLRRVDRMLRGVAVPPGEHRVEMRFVPEGWPTAARVTRWALLLWALGATGLLAAWRWRRPHGAPRRRGAPA